MGLLESVRVNQVDTLWLIDTGAARAVVSAKEAQKLGLEKSTIKVKVSGIGEKLAVQAEPVQLEWRGKSCITSPLIVDNLVVPGLLGFYESKELGMVIRPGSKTVNVNVMDEGRIQSYEPTEQLPLPKSVTKGDMRDSNESLLRSKISNDLSPLQQACVWDILNRYSEVWSRPRFGCVKTKAHFQAIDRPVKDKLRPMSEELRTEMNKQIDELLEARVIRPSKSPWASSAVFVRKADGTWRMAIDYRRVNKRIKTDGYPIPLLWEQLQVAAGHIYYAKLDGKSGFFNVPLTEQSKELTAFNTHRGLFEYNVLPFGIKNSPGEFQRVMDKLLSDLYGKGVLCYIDDIVIYSNLFDAWVKLIEEVLIRLRQGGVYVEPKKCELGSKEIKLLGHVVSRDGIAPNPEKVQAIRNAAPPTTRKELMSFLGLVGFIRRFIPGYSERTVALSGLLKKRQKFEWTSDCQIEFENLKQVITEHVLLSVPCGRGPFVLLCDASERAIGSVLSQWRNNVIHVLEFASKKFSPAEINWSTREKEAFAIRWSIQRFEPYIKGAKIYVFTDHASLQWLDSASSGKVQRWALYLQQYDIRVRAINGMDNGMADWLSRALIAPDPLADNEIEMISTPVCPVKSVDLKDESLKAFALSPYLPTLEQWIEASKEIPTGDKPYIRQNSDGLWYSVAGKKLYVPEILREALLYWFHAGRYGGHLGVNRTAKRLGRWFYWPKQKSDVAKYISACLPCKRLGMPTTRYLRQVLERSEPFQLISLDHVGPREWGGSKVYYLVIIDHFSRFVVAKSVEMIAAGETVTILREFWVNIFGAPEAVLVDRGAVFTAKIFQTYVRNELVANLVYCGVGYPQGNAINESVHRGIEASIAARRQYDTFTEYSEILSDAVLAYNTTPHSSTGLSPYYLLFGREMILPGLQRFREELPEDVRRSRIRDVRYQAMHRAVMSMDDNLRLRSISEIKVGDMIVYYLSERDRSSNSTQEGENLIKYSPKWSTPVHVTAVTKNNVEVETALKRKINIPLRLVRKISGNVPLSLQALRLDRVEKEPARLRLKPEWSTNKLSVKRVKTDN